MVLQLLRNTYGQKQGPKVWGDFLHQGLIKAGFQQSQVDPCVLQTQLDLSHLD